MITKETFLKAFNGHGNAYSSYCVIGVTLDDLLKTLNELNSDMCVGSGQVEDKCIRFEICKESPDLIFPITEKLHCKGFADIDGWDGYSYFTACQNGKKYDDFTAGWIDESPCRRDWDYDNANELGDEEIEWDAFILVVDNESNVEFYTGEGCVDYETLNRWKALVKTP